MNHDIFLSYARVDFPFVEFLKHALEDRGLSVWVDRYAIAPSESFARSIARGMESSRCIGIVLTPASLKSKWVKKEIDLSLTLEISKNIKIIPILVGDVEVPGFLSTKLPVRFESHNCDPDVDRLVWPGITGKSVRGLTFDHDSGDPSSELLHQAVEEEIGHNFIRLSSNRMHEWFLRQPDGQETYGHQFFPADSGYGVIFLDFDRTQNQYGGYQQFVDFIIKCRESTDGVNENLQFVICAAPGWLDRLSSSDIKNKKKMVKKISNYFCLEKTKDIDKLKRDLRKRWNATQQDLMRRERGYW